MGYSPTYFQTQVTVLLFDQQPYFYPTERTGGIAFGDLDQRRDRNNIKRLIL